MGFDPLKIQIGHGFAVIKNLECKTKSSGRNRKKDYEVSIQFNKKSIDFDVAASSALNAMKTVAMILATEGASFEKGAHFDVIINTNEAGIEGEVAFNGANETHHASVVNPDFLGRLNTIVKTAGIVDEDKATDEKLQDEADAFVSHCENLKAQVDVLDKERKRLKRKGKPILSAEEQADEDKEKAELQRQIEAITNKADGTKKTDVELKPEEKRELQRKLKQINERTKPLTPQETQRLQEFDSMRLSPKSFKSKLPVIGEKEIDLPSWTKKSYSLNELKAEVAKVYQEALAIQAEVNTKHRERAVLEQEFLSVYAESTANSIDLRKELAESLKSDQPDIDRLREEIEAAKETNKRLLEEEIDNPDNANQKQKRAQLLEAAKNGLEALKTERKEIIGKAISNLKNININATEGDVEYFGKNNKLSEAINHQITAAVQGINRLADETEILEESACKALKVVRVGNTNIGVMKTNIKEAENNLKALKGEAYNANEAKIAANEEKLKQIEGARKERKEEIARLRRSVELEETKLLDYESGSLRGLESRLSKARQNVDKSQLLVKLDRLIKANRGA